MSSYLFIQRSSRALITVLSTPKAGRVVKRIMAGALIADLIILPGLFWRLSTTLHVTPVLAATQSGNEISTGPATALFMQQLKDNNFVPVVFKKIIRRPLSGDGNLITLNGEMKDNMQVFEYVDHDTALKDASLLADKYATGSKKLTWKKNMHVYVDDKLVIFYLGSQLPITTVLDQHAIAFMSQSAEPLASLPKSKGI